MGVIAHLSALSPAVTLGLDPRGLNLLRHPQLKSHRVKPEGDDQWVGRLPRQNCNLVEGQKHD